MKDWPGRKQKDFGGAGLPIVTLADKTQMAESMVTSIYFAKKFGQYPADPLEAHESERVLS